MKKLILLMILGISACSVSWADCDYSKIINNPDGTFTYSKELHLCVGKLVKASALKDEQILALNKTIELKDLALQKSEERANLWMETSLKVTDTLNHYESLRQNTGILYFGLGVVVTVASVWAAGQLVHH